MKTIRQIIIDLCDRGMTCSEIARITEQDVSAIGKVFRGRQKSLSYEQGKPIELLEIKLRRKNVKAKNAPVK